MRLVTVDLETRYATGYSLTSMTPLEYVMDDRFQTIGISIKVDNYPTDVFFGDTAVRKALQSMAGILDDALLIGHNMLGFDSYVLAYRYGVRPKMWGCTMAMARPIHAKTCGLGLAKLVAHYSKELAAMGIANVKDNTVLVQTRGKRLEDFTPPEIEAMRVYNRNDTDQCYGLFQLLRKYYTASELWQIDAITRMRTEPAFELDVPLLETAASVERTRKHAALLDLAHTLKLEGVDWSDDNAVAEQIRSELASAPKFSAMLEGLGVEVPMKPSPTVEGKMVPALAKTDEGFLALQEHDNPIVAAAARARLDVKSTLLETRIQKFLTAGALAGGHLPIPIRYCGADTTGRDSGEEYNPQNLPRVNPKQPKPSDALRRSLTAGKGKAVIVADQSGIELRVNHFLWKVPSSMALYQADPMADLYRAFSAENVYHITPDEVTKDQRHIGKLCLVEGTLVLTKRGEVPIEEVTYRDKVWDGIEWSNTLGAIYKGEQYAIEYDGLAATPDHEVWVEDGRKVRLGFAAAQSLRLARSGEGGTPLGFGGAAEQGSDGGTDCSAVGAALVQTKRRVWDLLECGSRHRFTANGRLVSNCHLGLGFGSGHATFQRIAKVMGGIDIPLGGVDPQTGEIMEGKNGEPTCKDLVDTWREAYCEIVQGWRECGRALLYIDQDMEKEVDPWGLVHTTPEGFRLPSGRVIRYPDLRQEEDGQWPDGRPRRSWFYAHGRHKARITGPKADENIVQALARDSIFDCAVEYFRLTGLRPALRVHDELVYVVDETRASELLDTLQGVLRTPPKWWPQLVVWSEGDTAKNYGAAK